MYSDRLKELREEANLTQQTLADYLNIDRGQYGHYENEYDLIPIKYLIQLCDYFKVSLDYVFGFSEITIYNNEKEGSFLDITGIRLKAFRKGNKITQDKIAQVLNVDRSTIAKYESGHYLISTLFLYTICKKYNVSADYLLGKID